MLVDISNCEQAATTTVYFKSPTPSGKFPCSNLGNPSTTSKNFISKTEKPIVYLSAKISL